MKEKEVFGYMCGIDWQHELGEALGGNTIYPDVQDLKDNHKAWKECGIVKVRVTGVEWVEPQNLFGLNKNDSQN